MKYKTNNIPQNANLKTDSRQFANHWFEYGSIDAKVSAQYKKSDQPTDFWHEHHFQHFIYNFWCKRLNGNHRLSVFNIDRDYFSCELRKFYLEDASTFWIDQ